MCTTPSQTDDQQNKQASAMESRDEKKTCLEEKTVEAESTDPWLSVNDDTLPWLSVDNDTLVSTAVRLMLSIVVSCSVSTIAFILKIHGSYANTIMCNIYVSVIMLWVLLMCFVFYRFMLDGMLKEKSDDTKVCFRAGMLLNVSIVFTGVIYACNSWDDNAKLLFGMLFVGVFNSMAMLMFHEAKTKKEEENRKTILTHKTFDVPKGFQVV